MASHDLRKPGSVKGSSGKGTGLSPYMNQAQPARALAPEGRLLRIFAEPSETAKQARNDGEAGFTLIELMIVMLIIGVLMTIAIPNYTASVKAAKESVLKEDLHVMRGAIDSYTMDKQKAPQSLQDLVEAGYLRVIPIDPMTRQADTWVPDQSDAMHSLDQTEPGIDDVHSGDQEAGSDGQPYSTW